MSKLKELVISEAKALKKHATKEELDRLDFTYLNPSRTDSCIYGQATGDCFSYRATELITKCTKRVYSVLIGGGVDASMKLNGVPSYTPGIQRKYTYFSPIEKFIYSEKIKGRTENNSRLIDFLKGKTKTLKFV